MKKLLTILILIAPLFTQAQSLFGFSPSEIRERRPNVEWVYDKWGDSKELLAMGFTADGMHVTYLFNASNTSVFTIATPLTKGSLQALIETYNKKYVIIDNYHWKYYADGSVYYCALNQTDEGAYYFLWSLE